MLKFFISPRAEKDLEMIFNYTVSTWSFEQATKYQHELNEAFDLISNYPEIGKDYIHKRGDYKIFHRGRHLLFYQIKFEKIILMRILHESMDLEHEM